MLAFALPASIVLPASLALIALAIFAIVRQIDVRLVLFVTALALGGLAGQVDVIVRKFLVTFSDEKFVIPICTAMGFSYVLRRTGCDQHLVRLLVRPLLRVRFLLVPGTIVVGFLVNMPVVSQTSTAVSIGPVIIPILQAAGIDAPVIGGAILIGSSIGGELFNPGAPELRTTIVESKKAAEELGLPSDVYTSEHCVRRIRPLNLLGLAVATAVYCWTTRRRGAPSAPGFARGEGRGEGGQDPTRDRDFDQGSLTPLTPVPGSPAKPGGEGGQIVDLRIDYLKAIVPVFPLVFLYLTAPGIGVFQLNPQLLEDRPGQFETRLIGLAMLLGAGLAVLTEPRQIRHVAEAFFQGAGYGFANIVSLIVAANCFGESLKLVGAAAIFESNIGQSPHALLAIAGVASLGFAFLSGSGMATAQSLFGFFAKPALEMNIDPAHVGAVVSIAAAAGRTGSPVSAVTLMTARLTDTKPFELVRLVLPPLLVAVAAMIVASMLFVPPAPG
jgi:C4-dicarboxylate transporter, DcuC family